MIQWRLESFLKEQLEGQVVGLNSQGVAYKPKQVPFFTNSL